MKLTGDGVNISGLIVVIFLFLITVAGIYLIRMTSINSEGCPSNLLESVFIERQLLTGYHVCV